MADENGQNSYEMRRDARNEAQPAKGVSWRRWFISGGVVLALLVVGGISAAIWYYVTYVPTLSARVRAAVVELSPKVDARLLEVHVDEYQRVEKGQVVARLDDTELRAFLSAAEADRSIRESACLQARAQARLTGSQVEADIVMASARVAVAEARVASLKAQLSAARRRLPEQIRQAQARQDRQEAELDRLRAGPRKEELEGAREYIAAAKTTLALCELEVSQSRELVQEGIDSTYILEVRKTRLENQKHTLRQAELALQLLEAGSRPEEIKAAEKAVEMEAASVAMAACGKDDLIATERLLEIRGAECKEAEAQLGVAKARREEIAIARQRVEAAEAELRKAEATVKARQAAVGGMEIVSPINGVVTRVFCKVGEICRKGVPIILVSDESKPRWIDAFVDEEDAMKVDVGQSAWLTVPANSRNRVKATVRQVGLHTQTLDRGAGGQAEQTTAFGQSDRVWIRLVPVEPLAEHTVTGTTARGFIRVR
ncbi:MAG: efflux RND transporter periplasmic adaptor subunit [Lentisphaeria bacterium]|nr:efflux RND transporter periplasmic adaptor subunit [Lentisphaeria bacterium]